MELVACRSVPESRGSWHSNAWQCWQSLGMDALSSAHRWCLGIKDLLPKTLAEWDKAFLQKNSGSPTPMVVPHCALWLHRCPGSRVGQGSGAALSQAGTAASHGICISRAGCFNFKQ